MQTFKRKKKCNSGKQHFDVSTNYRIKESSGWQQVFSSPYLDWTIERIALNAKVVGGPHGDKDKMVAAASESSIILWSIQDGGSGNEIGGFADLRKRYPDREISRTEQTLSCSISEGVWSLQILRPGCIKSFLY